MAHKSGDTVTPTKKGEFCGNWTEKLPPVAQFEHESLGPDFSIHRIGRPRPAGGKTVAEMEADGWVGVYLKVDVRPPVGAVEIPWFTEPGADQ